MLEPTDHSHLLSNSIIKRSWYCLTNATLSFLQPTTKTQQYSFRDVTTHYKILLENNEFPLHVILTGFHVSLTYKDFEAAFLNESASNMRKSNFESDFGETYQELVTLSS